MDRGAWQATVSGIAEWDMTEHMGNTPPIASGGSGLGRFLLTLKSYRSISSGQN